MGSSQGLQGKIAIVTGGGGGFGEAITQKFTDEGAKILVVDVDDILGMKVAEKMAKGSAVYLHADVTSEADWKRILDSAVAEFGGLDIVINNAGVIYDSKPSTDITDDEYERIMRINVKPLFLSSKVIIPYFQKKGSGLFINTSSTSSTRPRAGQVWYGATKGAVNNITRGLAIEWASSGIRFNAVCPALATTRMMESVLGADSDVHNKILRSIPLGRWCEPRDVANSMAFLASEDSTYITGLCMDVDGGRGI